MTTNKTIQTEPEIIGGLTPDAQELLKRVLEIELSRLHLTGSDAIVVDDLHQAVLGIIA